MICTARSGHGNDSCSLSSRAGQPPASAARQSGVARWFPSKDCAGMLSLKVIFIKSSAVAAILTAVAFSCNSAVCMHSKPTRSKIQWSVLQLPQNPAEAALSTLGLANGDTVVVRRVAPATAQQPVGRSNGSPYTGGVPQGQHNNEPQASQTGDALQATERISNVGLTRLQGIFFRLCHVAMCHAVMICHVVMAACHVMSNCMSD